VIRFPCPNCAGALKVADESAGETIKCPKCGRAATAPESLDDDPPAAELDETPRRRLSRRAWAAIAAGGFVLVALTIGVIVFVRSGTRDGMTRAEREAFEANFRSELVGVWDATEGPEWKNPDEGSHHLFTFTEDGRFEAVRYRDGKKAGSHSGRWSVTGKKLAIEVDESSDDSVSTSKMVPCDIHEIKSEKGRMFRFALGRYQQAGYHTFRRWTEPPKTPPAALPKKGDAQTDDLRFIRWLPGRWSSEVGTTAWEWRFDELGSYEVKVTRGGQSLGSFSGQWFVRASQLTLTVGISLYEPVPANSTQTYVVAFPAEHGFILVTATKDYFTTLARKK
jgi:hypothetical protein